MKFNQIFYSVIIVFILNSCNGNANTTENKETEDLTEFISGRVIELNDLTQLSSLTAEAANKSLVLLGEATHGTSEFYRWRSKISLKLIEEHDFNFIAVEGDWASIYKLNKYVKHKDGSAKSANEILKTFERWPVWMWANTDILELAEKLRTHNEDLTAGQRVGFYGMDVYGHEDAADMIIDFFESYLMKDLEKVKSELYCFLSYDDPWMYARYVAQGGESCHPKLKNIEELLISYESNFTGNRQIYYYNALQNIMVVKNAEDYYRKAVRAGPDSWNSRVDHMYKTVNRLLHKYGEDSKGIVWAHNTHVGDASATPMLQQGMYNIGYLSRQEFGIENVFIVGFGTYIGTVNAGRRWGDEMQIFNIPKAINGSYEALFEKTGIEQFLWIFNESDRNHTELMNQRGHRAIGVVYDPAQEHRGNFVPTLLPERYDAFIFIRETNALKAVN